MLTGRDATKSLEEFTPAELHGLKFSGYEQKAKDRAAMWRGIAQLPVASVTETIQKIVRSAPPTWQDWIAWRKAPEDVAAIAESLGVAVPPPVEKKKAKKETPKPADKPKADKPKAAKPAGKPAPKKKAAPKKKKPASKGKAK